MTPDQAASWLFVPGSRPERFDTAATSGAHEIIIDLEDAVAPGQKRFARDDVAHWLTSRGSAWVRVNAAGTPWHDDDLATLAACPELRGVVVPKAVGPIALARIAERLPAETPVIALVETALGIHNVAAVAACPAVSRLAFGSVDFALDIDSDESDEALLLARSAQVIASRVALLPPPIDGVCVETRDTTIIARAAVRARSLGFGGKLCIHPAQVGPVNAAFAPDRADLDWAHRVLSTAAGHGDGPISEGVFRMDDQMIDKPLLDKARRIIARGVRG
ncbi:HpcH/HpaI aldolase/citrate lyase family protein [Nonomuraea lactucae]|uniref:HpcH/HpaI aldolase/citrate lyase family protein n=1 Tax=Nonomuraea lactucae TaxID=2249762 RepID=UPI000DE52AD1|nr:CoA ester lyase [Nonomuraea lactucae]